MTDYDISELAQLFAQLARVDKQRRDLFDALHAAGLRSRGLVGEWGEVIAAEYYGVPLARTSEPGFDLVDRQDRKVQVRTLRSTPGNDRTSLGVFREPWDVAFCLRLDSDYLPKKAFEVPRSVMEQRYPPGTRASLIKWVECHPDTIKIERDQLRALLER